MIALEIDGGEYYQGVGMIEGILEKKRGKGKGGRMINVLSYSDLIVLAKHSKSSCC